MSNASWLVVAVKSDGRRELVVVTLQDGLQVNEWTKGEFGGKKYAI